MTRNRLSRGLRILFLVHSLRRGGAERVLLEIALGLRERGHEVAVAAWLDVDEYGEERYRSIPRHFLMAASEYRWPWSVYRAAERLKSIVAEFMPQAIELHTPTMAWVAAWAGLRIPCVHVVQGYGAITRQGSLKDWVMRLGDRWAHRVLDAEFIVPALPMAAVSLAHFSRHGAKVDCVPNGVDVDTFVPIAKDSKKNISIMMLGTLSPHKGQQYGVRAMKGLRMRIPGAQLNIVGEGLYRPELAKLVNDLDLSGCVQLTGRRKDAFEIMASSHLFWHLSESEGLPMVVIEAMASGVPVIGFDVRGTRDVVVDGVTGFLVPFGDIDAVVEKTLALMCDIALYQGMCIRAREIARERFSIESMVKGHETVMLRVAGK